MVSVICGLLRLGKKFEIKETVHKFQNARQVRTGHNVVKSSSPNVPGT
jgi:hypothetical protein